MELTNVNNEKLMNDFLMDVGLFQCLDKVSFVETICELKRTALVLVRKVYVMVLFSMSYVVHSKYSDYFVA